jgi:hypothetical protein
MVASFVGDLVSVVPVLIAPARRVLVFWLNSVVGVAVFRARMRSVGTPATPKILWGLFEGVSSEMGSSQSFFEML